MASYTRPFRFVLILVYFGAILAPCGLVAQEQNDEIVVLRNGGIFVGEVSERNDHLLIKIAKGGEVRLAYDTVDFRANTMQDVYAVLVRRTTRGNPSQHLGLSDWCVNEGLIREADIELELASRSGADPRSIEKRRRYINELLEREQARQQAIANSMNPLDQPTVETNRIGPFGEPPRLENPNSLAADHHRLENQVDPINDSLTTTHMENANADSAASLPAEIKIAFKRDIQPRLMHGCAASNCHGPSGQGGFSLERVARGRPVTNSMTERNLARVVQLVDTSAPEFSPLLRASAELHVGREVPIFPRHSGEHFKALEEWVHQVTAARTAQQIVDSGAPVEVGSNISDVVQTIPRLQGGRIPVESPPAEQTAGETPIQPATFDEEVAESETEKPFRPVDPFDPEIFNRYATGQLKPKEDKTTPELLDVKPIPSDPIGRPDDQIEPPQRNGGQG